MWFRHVIRDAHKYCDAYVLHSQGSLHSNNTVVTVPWFAVKSFASTVQQSARRKSVSWRRWMVQTFTWNSSTEKGDDNMQASKRSYPGWPTMRHWRDEELGQTGLVDPSAKRPDDKHRACGGTRQGATLKATFFATPCVAFARGKKALYASLKNKTLLQTLQLKTERGILFENRFSNSALTLILNVPKKISKGPFHFLPPLCTQYWRLNVHHRELTSASFKVFRIC